MIDVDDLVKKYHLYDSGRRCEYCGLADGRFVYYIPNIIQQKFDGYMYLCEECLEDWEEDDAS
jgi:hypothetical protein